MSILFKDIIFGPVHSRRLGVSLGINLLPTDYKFCTFNCIYCECGWSHKEKGNEKKLPSRKEVAMHLQKALAEMKTSGRRPDAITFAGNGEPTIHPEFARIMEDTLQVRDLFFPDAAVTVLSNASTLEKKEIFEALKKADKNILKLDAGTEEMFRLINDPRSRISLAEVVDHLKKFNGNLIIQTLFLRGEYKGNKVDNTSGEELKAWLDLISQIRPKSVMIYPIDRQTPVETLEKISFEELKQIARKIEEEAGIRTEVFS